MGGGVSWGQGGCKVGMGLEALGLHWSGQTTDGRGWVVEENSNKTSIGVGQGGFGFLPPITCTSAFSDTYSKKEINNTNSRSLVGLPSSFSIN